MITKYELREYLHLKQQSELAKQTLMERKISMQSVQAQKLTGMPGAHSEDDKMATMMASLVDLEDTIMKLEAEIDMKLKRVIQEIKTLPPELQNIFWLRYISGDKWEDIAYQLHYSWQHIHKLHRKGLELLRGD